MGTDTYPGKGLSLTQLVFALNEELRASAHPSFFTPDAISQLERDISTALRTVREVKNTFAPINRVPSDVLSLIPTHLPLQKDRFRTTFVCRHWRSVFLQHAALWSQLFTKKGEEYMTVLLKRAKGSTLDIVIKYSAHPGTMALLSPLTRQISSLSLSIFFWKDVLEFSEVTSAPLPLLRTLEIRITYPDGHHDEPNMPTAPLLPLFNGAVNLEEFIFQPKWSASFNHFAFPTLTTLKLLILPMNRWITQELFDFLKASPTLLTVEIRVEEGGTPENIPREMAVVLPNVETLSLNVDGDGLQVYKLALHISCPRAKCTSLMQEICDFEVDTSPGVFPDPDSWKAIARQYTTSPVEEVTLEVKGPEYSSIFTYSLTFKSSDATTVSLGFRAIELDREVHVLGPSDEEMNFEIFSQACRTIRGHPQLSNLKRLHIKNSSQFFDDDDDYTTNMTEVLWGFFGSLGPLDELIMYRCDPQVFVSEIENANRAFSVVKELTLLDICMVDEERCGDAIVELARSQHEMGKPFERITVHGWGIPQAMAGELRRWVGEVDCYERESFRSPSVEV